MIRIQSKILAAVKKLYESNWFGLLVVLFFSLVVFAVSIRITYSRYTNFENGKFDLGNMVQMVWNTSQGRFMYLTDYFGTNMPRWGMSHVDPFLIVFVPFLVIFKSPLVLVFGQLFLVIFSSLVLYKIAELETKNRLLAVFVSLSYLFYPALGFILTWTDFHGVTAVMPFFFLGFYLFEKMYHEKSFPKSKLLWFWICLVLAMMGKEEIPIFVALFGLFILLFRNDFSSYLDKFFDPIFNKTDILKSFLSTTIAKNALGMMVIGSLWFYYAFFVLIPQSAHYRVNGYNKFVNSIGITPEETENVDSENYFLLRYEEFGSSYGEILLNMAKNPTKVMSAWTDGSKPDYFKQTFMPLLYLPLLYPPIFAISIPELIINYTSTSGGVSTANIENHRISMIIVILFISLVYGINFIARFAEKYFGVKAKYVQTGLALLLLLANIQKTFEYKNPIYLWMQQAVGRRIVGIVKAEDNIINDQMAFSPKLKEGDSVKLVRLEQKDRDCAGYIMNYIPPIASVSGPDYMGAKLSMRETYALFPALFNEADYIIADIYARKVSRVLGIPSIIVNSKVADIMSNPNYHLKFVCGNLALFERSEVSNPGSIELPIQEVFSYQPKVDYAIYRGVFLRDYSIPSTITRKDFYKTQFVYERKESNSLDDYKLFLTFVDMESDKYFQIPHLATYSMTPLKDFDYKRYYVENVDVMLPEFMNVGSYRVFLGLTNGLETQSIFLKEIEVK
jgi:uncharacterized membrane protein